MIWKITAWLCINVQTHSLPEVRPPASVWGPRASLLVVFRDLTSDTLRPGGTPLDLHIRQKVWVAFQMIAQVKTFPDGAALRRKFLRLK